MADDFSWSQNYFDTLPWFWPTVIAITLFVTIVVALVVLVVLPTQQGHEENDVEVTGSGDVGQRRRTFQRFRSVSLSVDIDLSDYTCPELMPPVSGMVTNSTWQRHQQRVLAGGCDRYRTLSTNYMEQYRLLHHADSADLTVWKKKGMEMLRRVPEAFPFQSLPNDCRLIVFSFLSATERGVASRVCTNWHDLMKTPSLWTTVDFNSFPFCRKCSQAGRSCTPLCYAAYKSRLKSFFKFLTSVKPTLHCLRAAFDIGDHRDGWLEHLQVNVLLLSMQNEFQSGRLEIEKYA